MVPEKQFQTNAWQQFVQFQQSMANETISYFTKTNFPSFLTLHNTLTQGSLLSKNSPVSEKEHAHSLSTTRIRIYSTRIEKEGT